MRSSWNQPSLSRDFALLSAAILFILCIISGWVTFNANTQHAETVAADLEKESKHIEMALSIQMEDASYMLTSLGKQIVLDPDRNLVKLAQTLKSFDKKDYVYSILSWVNPEQQNAVSSNKGVLEKPVDISDRDYVKMAPADPWKMVIGHPIEGRVSERWVIPVAMGLTDYTGKFIGSVMISLDINALTSKLTSLVQRDGISFAIVSKTLIPITQISEDKDFVNNNFPIQKLVNFNFSKSPSGMISQGSPFWNTGIYAYYHALPDLPYVILLTYDARYSDETVRGYLWYRLMQMAAMAMFFVLFLWITRIRMIKPILEMAAITADVAKGNVPERLPKGGPIEIEGLATQIHKVSEYIEENKRVEKELRNKISQYRKAKEQAEIDRRSQSEFIACVGQEMSSPLNNIVGSAQILKEHLHEHHENHKYAQYATDIHDTGNNLIKLTKDFVAIAKADSGYAKLDEKIVDVSAVINRAARFVSEMAQAEKIKIDVQVHEPVPRLIADEFRLQQILMNLLIHAMGHTSAEGVIALEGMLISEAREKSYFAFVISSSGKSPYTQSQLLRMADELSSIPAHGHAVNPLSSASEKIDIGLELARALIFLHNATIDITSHPDNSVAIAVFFQSGRVKFTDMMDR